MYVYGIDPGPTLHGWAILEITAQKRVLFDAGRSTTDDVIGYLKSCVGRGLIDLVAIEWASQVLGGENIQRVRAISKTLIATQAEAGRMLEACEACGEPCSKHPTFKIGRRLKAVKISAADWRRGIVGSRSPTDKMVRESVSRLVKGVFPGKAGPHAYDAAGVALAAFNGSGRDVRLDIAKEEKQT